MSDGLYGYSSASIEAFGREIEDLYLRTKAKVGVQDLEEMQALDKYSGYFDKTGRALIHFSPEPLSYFAGIGLLAAHFVMEFSNGHNILHGHYDAIPGHGHINSRDFRWDNTMHETDWKFEHHVCHHPFTNIDGKDHDFGYLLFRLNSQQEWQPRHLFQLAGLLAMPGAMTYYMPTYIATARALFEERAPATWRTYGPAITKILKTLGRDYLLYPLLAGPFFPKVFVGNMLARILAGGHLMYMLAFEHHSKSIPLVEDPENETSYEFYLRQVLTTRNYVVWDWYERLLMGSVNTHIEHHLFPDLPFNRLKEISGDVETICKKYSVPYRKSSVLESFGDLMGIAIRNSLPVKPGESVIQLLTNPVELGSRMIVAARESWLPLLLGKSHDTFARARIENVVAITADVTAITLSNPWQDARFRPGQYISVQLEVAGKNTTRQYSITHFSEKTISIAVRRIDTGKVSPRMHKLKKGDQLELVGKIKGEFTLDHADKKILFFAGGVGLTPILAMLQHLEADQTAVLLYFNRSKEHVLFSEELEILQAQKQVRVIHILDDAPDGKYSFEQITKHVPDYHEHAIYSCAPQVVLEMLESDLRSAKFDLKQYRTERFAAAELPQLPKSGVSHKVRFLSSDMSVDVDENETLLMAIERAGLVIPTGCRAGMCKACTVQLESGDTDKSSGGFKGYITTCNAYPRSPIDLWI
jgi:stearoyl-CoA 9-desaturase NADPH oxidoreductase